MKWNMMTEFQKNYLCADAWGPMASGPVDGVQLNQYMEVLNYIASCGPKGAELVLYGAVDIDHENQLGPLLKNHQHLVFSEEIEGKMVAYLKSYNMAISLQALGPRLSEIARQSWMMRRGFDVNKEHIKQLFFDAAELDPLAWYSLSLVWIHLYVEVSKAKDVTLCFVVPYKEHESTLSIARRAAALAYPLDDECGMSIRYLVALNQPLSFTHYLIIPYEDLHIDVFSSDHFDSLYSEIEKKLGEINTAGGLPESNQIVDKFTTLYDI